MGSNQGSSKTGTRMLGKRIAAAALSATVLAGGSAVAVGVLGSSAASAADNTSSSSSSSNTPKARGEWVTDALKPLVDAGTINQSQADAVAKALADARPTDGGHGPGGPGRGGPGGPSSKAAAAAIGIEASALREALQSGQTIAEVAEAHDVDISEVIAAIVADMSSHLDDAVSDGRITQAQADGRKADATERATAIVNGERPAGGPPGPPPEQ